MAKVRGKTISYRRAVWFLADGKEKNFEKLLREAHKKLAKVSDRKFKRGDGQVLKSIWHAPEKSGGGYYVHIAAETPGDQASTIPQAGETQTGHGVSTAPPPTGTEYMDGDVIIFVRGNDICLCSTVIREGAVAIFCSELFKKAKLGADAMQFELQKVANVDKVKMINAQGVKEIDLTATLYEASAKYTKRTTAVSTALQGVSRHLSAIFGKDERPARDNIKVGITLKTDDRMKAGKAIGERRLNAAAAELVQSDDDLSEGYVIVTRKGQRISQDEVFVRHRVDIERHGKSVNRDKACAALKKFHSELVKTGVTAQ